MTVNGEDYVSFETAKLLKEKGFEQYKCQHSYNSKGAFKWSDNLDPYEYAAPSQAMAMRWLREVHNLHIDVDPSEGDWNPIVLKLEDWSCVVKPGDELPIQDSYEEACEVAIKYALDNLI